MLLLASGCGGGGGGSTSQDVGVDTTKPAITYAAPANRDTSVGTNSTITVSFSEAMNPATINSNTFTVSAPDGSKVSAAVVYDADNRIAQFKPAAAMNPNTVYTVAVDHEVTDQAGNAMGTSYSWAFTTESAADTTAPTVISHSPQGNDVPVNSQIAAVLSEAVDPATLTAATFTISGNGNAITGNVTLVGTTAIFTPGSSLAANTNYTATLTTGVKDLAANSMTAGYSWSFTTRSSATPDRVIPRIISTNPADDAQNVPLNATIFILFDKPIYPILLGLVDGIPTKTVITYNPDLTTEIRIIPTQDLKPGGTYRSRIAPKDLSGNQIATYTWEFSTVP